MDKSVGESSARAIARLKRKFSLKKIGHAGTLDPMATGLLVCLSGRATKLASLAQGGIKSYSGVILLGRTTDTDDVTGKTVYESDKLPHAEAVLKASRNFIGEISQLPPQISALKVDGKRSYKRARAGEQVALKPRTVSISSFDIEPLSEREYKFRIVCGSGTYIRAIARDLGNMFGCGGCLAELRREGSAPFSVNQAKTIDHILADDILRCEILSGDQIAHTGGVCRR